MRWAQRTHPRRLLIHLQSLFQTARRTLETGRHSWVFTGSEIYFEGVREGREADEGRGFASELIDGIRLCFWKLVGGDGDFVRGLETHKALLLLGFFHTLFFMHFFLQAELGRM